MSLRRSGEQFQFSQNLEQPQDSSDDLHSEPSLPLKGANVARKKSVLGRGLSALLSSSAVPVDISSIPLAGTGQTVGLPESEGEDVKQLSASPEIVPFTEETPDGGLVYLSLDRIAANPSQPRKVFSEDELRELSATIRRTGLLQPIVVRRKSGESGQLASYEIVAGERRFRAARLAGLTRIPAILRQLSDQEALEIGIVENVQRANLNPIEEAAAYQRLIDEFGATQAEVAEKVGKDRVSVANTLRLLRLDSEVQELLSAGKISAGHGRALLVLDDKALQQKLAERIQNEHLSVRETEALAAGRNLPATGQIVPAQVLSSLHGPEAEREERKVQKVKKSSKILALEERLRSVLGTKVDLHLTQAGAGVLRISFFSLEELEGIVERLEQ